MRNKLVCVKMRIKLPEPQVGRKAHLGTLPMKLRKNDRVFVKEEKKRRSEKFSRRMRKGEYKDLVLKILSEMSLKRQ